MKKLLISTALFACSLAALAQMTPVGLWRNVDDKTGETKGEIRISDKGGVLSGVVERVLVDDPETTCVKCTDDRKDKPKVGLEIIRGAKKADADNTWVDGNILDPENGKVYKLKLEPLDGGKKLQVRGYIGPFYRTQVWVRAQ